jgi:hypothetical protein
MKCGFFENVLSRAWAIHAAGDKWAGHGGPALPLPPTTDLFPSKIKIPQSSFINP